MPYTGRHKLLTAFGTAWGGSEEWSFGIRFAPGVNSNQVSQAQADNAWAVVRAMWINTNMVIPPSFLLTGVKVAPIDTNGKYPVGEIAYEHLDPGVAGTGGAATQSPQVCLAVTTLSDLPRGRLSHGRFYLPAPAALIQATGTINPTYATAALPVLKTMMNGLNAVPDLGTASIYSNILGVGFRTISRLKMGSALDTQRRRRNHIPESYNTLVL